MGKCCQHTRHPKNPKNIAWKQLSIPTVYRYATFPEHSASAIVLRAPPGPSSDRMLCGAEPTTYTHMHTHTHAHTQRMYANLERVCGATPVFRVPRSDVFHDVLTGPDCAHVGMRGLRNGSGSIKSDALNRADAHGVAGWQGGTSGEKM